MLYIVEKILAFRHDERGAVLAETVIVLPMLLWSYLALFVYWDAFRSTNEVQKASYTISDIISREMRTVPPTYVTGIKNVAEFLVDTTQNVSLRVTSITYDEDDLQFKVLWSSTTDSLDMPALTTLTLQDLKSRIPNMKDADFATIVETKMLYVPAFNVGLSDQTLRQFIVTRQRFLSPFCMRGQPTCTPV